MYARAREWEKALPNQLAMASIKLRFHPSRNPNEEGSLYFTIYHRRHTLILHTGLHVRSEEWNPKTSFIQLKGTPKRQAQLKLIAGKAQWAYRRLTELVTSRELAKLEYEAKDIVADFHRLPDCPTWFHFMDETAKRTLETGRTGTAKTYRAALNSFMRFSRGEDMMAEDLSQELIARYETWLKQQGVGRNSSSCYLRTLRTLYRKAVEQGFTPDKKIFRHAFMGYAKTRKRAIPLHALRAIYGLKLKEGTALAFTRDIFMLSFFLQGISFIDLAYLRKSDLQGKRLLYRRKKTGQELSIRWEPAMQAIVDKYAGQTKGTPFLLPIITKQDPAEQRRQYESAEHAINYRLKKLGQMAGIGMPLTTYVARHSWASAMRDMTGDLSLISKGLGHESLKTTQIYLDSIDSAKVAKANGRMIRKIL